MVKLVPERVHAITDYDHSCTRNTLSRATVLGVGAFVEEVPAQPARALMNVVVGGNGDEATAVGADALGELTRRLVPESKLCSSRFLASFPCKSYWNVLELETRNALANVRESCYAEARAFLGRVQTAGSRRRFTKDLIT